MRFPDDDATNPASTPEVYGAALPMNIRLWQRADVEYSGVLI